MRVGLIIYGSIDTVTGGYIYDCKLLDFLRKQGVLVKVFSQKKGSFFSSVRHNFSRKLHKDLIDFSPDIILQDEMNFLSLIFLNHKLKKLAPLISIVHLLQSSLLKNSFLNFLTKRLEKRYLKTVNGYIFNSVSTQKSVQNLIGKVNNSVVAYPGKDRLQLSIQKELISPKCQNNPFYIIFIGNLLYNKGLHLLLKALSEIKFTSWQLSIVGGLHFEPKYTKKIAKQIKQLEFHDKVKIYGELTIETLKQIIPSHHVLVVPSYFESYGIVYTEVMGAGLPVIACRAGGTEEIVKDSINGFLISKGDSDMLGSCISQLIENRQLLEEMSFSSLSSYQNLPSWDESMAKVHHFLKENVEH